jgi:hypothetical protein
MEDELLGATAIAMTHDYDIDEDVVGDDDDNDDDDDACDAEVESKQQHQGHTSDSEENTEVKWTMDWLRWHSCWVLFVCCFLFESKNAEEDRLLADDENQTTTTTTVHFDSHNRTNEEYEFEANDLRGDDNDDVHLLESWHSIWFL